MPDPTYYMVQPTKHIPGSSISWTGGFYTPTHSGSDVQCKGAVSTSDGVLMVHLIDDAADTYFALKLVADKWTGCVFDKLKETGTTVTLADLTLFPAEFNLKRS